MTLKELFDQGGNAVGNYIVLRGGVSFLIGDATTRHGPINSDARIGWEGWLNQEVVFIANLFEHVDPSMIENIKARTSVEAPGASNEISYSRQ